MNALYDLIYDWLDKDANSIDFWGIIADEYGIFYEEGKIDDVDDLVTRLSKKQLKKFAKDYITDPARTRQKLGKYADLL